MRIHEFSLLVIIVTAVMSLGCATAYVPAAELGGYDGVYELSGSGPPNRPPLAGTLTIANGSYVLDTSFGRCKAQPLKVPKRRMDQRLGNSFQPLTRFGCGDLSMEVMLSDGRMFEHGMGTYWTETRVAQPRVCVAVPADSAARERGDCGRWQRGPDDVYNTPRYYGIRIARKSVT